MEHKKAAVNKLRNKKFIHAKPKYFWIEEAELQITRKGEDGFSIKPNFSGQKRKYSFQESFNAGGNYLDYSKLSLYPLERLKFDIKKLWSVRKKYLADNEIDKAKWWLETKIRPVLKVIEEKERLGRD